MKCNFDNNGSNDSQFNLHSNILSFQPTLQVYRKRIFQIIMAVGEKRQLERSQLTGVYYL